MAISKIALQEEGKVAYRVTLIPGDGIGLEVVEATRRVLEAAVAKVIAAGRDVTYDLKP
jgi:isocitrate/isopropylmalate dehydrogenase